MKVHGIKCKKCGDIIYSRARHDMRWCTCGACAIDGGQYDYIKITGDKEDWELTGDFDIKETFQQVHDDWSYGTNKLGLIKTEQMTIKEIMDEFEKEGSKC